MMDPDSGGKPPEGGASVAGRGEGRSSRRRKAKRRGKNLNAAPSVHAGTAQDAGPAGRPATDDALNPTRKRKRRRARSASAAKTEADGVTAVAVPARVPTAAGDTAGPGNPKKRRKKNRGGRGLQGRPLAQARAEPAYAPRPASPAGQAASVAMANGAGRIAPEAPRVYRDDFYAALDLGTNNCRLLIAQPTRPGQFRVVDAFSRIVRLGEGLAANRRLSNDAMDRAVDALKVCAAKLSTRPIRKMRLIATEACRAADNGEEFLSRVVRETGLDLEIIDRETEARLAVSGCSSLVGREARSVVLFDIGGGSSEIAVIRIDNNRSSRLANHITHWTSLPVGVVTLSERHGGRDVTPEVFEAMVTEVEGMLSSFHCPPVLAPQGGLDDFHLIGTSGTVTTLAGVHLDLPRYDRRKVDGLWLSDTEVTAMQAKLLSWGFADRAANPCIGPDRADLVLAGCAILEAIRRRWPSQRMRVADRGLREGILTDMMADDGAWRRIRPRRTEQERDEQGASR
ncbi:exopolyphosphatase [Pseudorhizobium pelagicum]|uniref:Exopolyphosphatase n=2 Tax=Pseudorhizobium pelagicum TaxID=1509405 RepID=A0A922P1R7_9HYPH|nr:Ppx/GppA phosphatase family protein [Pseudorhizobium pelagicum]KEQ09326.1 exopolyphosphatase [Pseudorhizobium pelagicum]KEQ10853.1 exopolyphosphatase [Pseudorhizobium pelagicum]